MERGIDVFDAVKTTVTPDREVLRSCLETGPGDEGLRLKADEVCTAECGRGVLVRGIIEFSNYCRNTCCYCGLRNANSGLLRYRLKHERIIEAADFLYRRGIRTVVLQSGEDPELSPAWLARVISEIKERFDIAVTLSVGEWPYEYYKMWRSAGADRFLLKIETTDRGLYERLHPGMSFENRLRCLDQLFELGYQNGSGIITGLPFQSIDSIAEDILFLYKKDFDMISVGPFIPHPGTPLGKYPRGSVDFACRVLALTRVVCGNAHMPATTALCAGRDDLRSQGLHWGANVIMPNCTPSWCAELYDIYPQDPEGENRNTDQICLIETAAGKAGKYLDFSRGDSLKKHHRIQKEQQDD